jgi:hypothetical protein
MFDVRRSSVSFSILPAVFLAGGGTELLNSYNRSFSISRGSVSLIEPENSSKDAGIYQA